MTTRRFPLALAVLVAPAALVLAAPPTTLSPVTVTGDRTSALTPSITEIPLDSPTTSTQVRELQDLGSRIPNFSVSSNSQHSFNDIYTLRGLGNTTFFSSPAVGFYVDDVPGGDAFSLFQPLYNVDRIDVYRGPQSSRYGLNGEAGLIELRTRRADTQAWHGEASASFGTYDTQEYRASVGGPLIKDKLTLDLSGFWSLGTGFIDNTFTHNREDDRDSLGGRAVLRFTPSPDWDIAAGFEWARVQDGAQRIVLLSGDPYQVRSDVPGSLNINQHREWLNIGKKFETWEMRSITSHSEWEVDPALLDIDFTPARAGFSGIFPGVLPFPFGGTSQIRHEQEVWSQEIRFGSLSPEPPTAAPDGKSTVHDKDGKKVILPVVQENHFRWNGGLFFQRKETSANDLRSFSAPFVTVDPFFFQPLTIYTPLQQRTRYSQEEENWAAYLNAGYTWGRLDIDAGIRIDYTRKAFNRTKTDPISLSAPVSFSAEYEEWTPSPTLGLTFRVNEHLDLFARSTYGFKPGGFSAYTDDKNLAQYDRETVWATEVGFRARALDNKLRGQFTAYYHSIDNYQVERTFSFTDYLVVNAGEARSKGLELELAYEPLPGLTLSGSFGYNETELHDYRDPFTGENLGGNEAPYVPNFTGLVAVDYQHPCGFRGHVEYVATGDTQYTDTNDDRFRQAAYGLLNARVGFERDHWGVYLFGRNLCNELYFTNKSSDTGSGIIGEPRVIGVMALLKF